MLTDLSWLDIGKPFPPQCTVNRLARYKKIKKSLRIIMSQYTENNGNALSVLSVILMMLLAMLLLQIIKN